MRARNATVLLLLAVMVAAAGVLTFESRRSAKAARDTAERVLRDYASFAAWQYARVASRALEHALNTAITQTPSAHARTAATASAADDCQCEGGSSGVITGFRLDTGTGKWIGTAPARAADREAIAGQFGAAASDADQRGFRLALLAGGAGAVAWHLDTRASGESPVAHGVLVNAAFVSRALEQAATEPLLPPALMTNADPARLLALSAVASDGHVLFGSTDVPWHAETASQPTPTAGGLMVAASISPDAAPHLIIGGMPRPRLLVIYALLGLACALVLTAGYQMHRQAELARIRADFVSGVSHELRTPLAQIRMFAETLRLGRVRTPAESSRALEVILQESQRLSHLVENVLLFARGERAAHSVHGVTTSLSGLVRDIAEDLRPLAHSRRAAIAAVIEPGVDAFVDPDAVRQVLLNLVDNALKYGPQGQTVTIGLLRDADSARLWVEDQGPGVAGDDVRHIWEPFWRRAKAGQGGSGIGLSIVRDLVRLHRGSAFVDAACATGARFVVTLPIGMPISSTASGLEPIDTVPNA